MGSGDKLQEQKQGLWELRREKGSGKAPERKRRGQERRWRDPCRESTEQASNLFPSLTEIQKEIILKFRGGR